MSVDISFFLYPFRNVNSPFHFRSLILILRTNESKKKQIFETQNEQTFCNGYGSPNLFFWKLRIDYSYIMCTIIFPDSLRHSAFSSVHVSVYLSETNASI